MIVIIEGLDASGKTTICKQIAQQYNYQYVKESYTDDSQQKKQRVLDMVDRIISDNNYIYDRTTLIDDFVYQFLNKTQSILKDHLDMIISILSKCKIIHLIADKQIISKRLNERGDQYINVEDLKKIQKNYKMFYEFLDNVHYVMVDDNLQQNVNRIVEVIKK